MKADSWVCAESASSVAVPAEESQNLSRKRLDGRTSDSSVGPLPVGAAETADGAARSVLYSFPYQQVAPTVSMEMMVTGCHH